MRYGQEISTSDRQPSRSWDIFCNVVDNYGDIGVCWRLARQLATEHRLRVRLWVDDLKSFARICPEIDPGLPQQESWGVDVRRWVPEGFTAVPAEVVIEAFGCGLPPDYVAALEPNPNRHVWINLEYLSAENWIDGCHGLPSPQTASRLTRHFYFPGFSEASGGLLREKDLQRQRREFREDPGQVGAFWQQLGLPPPAFQEIRISLFCYPRNAAAALFAAWSQADCPILCLVPEGVAVQQISAFFGQDCGGTGNLYEKGSLKVCVFRFLDQNNYDRLLWACDFNLVRGEDSFVRAQWAELPMIWQIYPQEENAHIIKLEAFLTRYCSGLAPEAAAVLGAFARQCNLRDSEEINWSELRRVWPQLQKNAVEWANTLMKKEDLATNLVHFCDNKLK